MWRIWVRKIALAGPLMIILAVLHAGAPSAAFAAQSSDAPTNQRMSASASPYLQTHAGDLVRWYAWGDEAFTRARELQRPLMVSFGYTACHWCHVMQAKHFNDREIARVINENFVPVLVDRERRPSLDEAYMLVTEVLTQRGGWPNTVFMTPERKPFYGTGYIPPDQFTQLLAAITVGWLDDRPSLIAEGDRLSSLLSAYMTRSEAAQSLSSDVLAKTAKSLTAEFDEFTGGMGEAPKFFQQPVLMFLLQQAEQDGDTAALEAVERTLQSVLSGGIHDHIEGGFHRYAIDPGWRVPHFEKMLYDQAQMAEAFTTAYRITGKPEYAATARKTFDYILADLTAPDGGFYATRDADSEGEEGTYYLWTPDQLKTVLGAEDASFAANTFGAIADGDFAGKIILNTDDVKDDAHARVERIFKALGNTRSTRPKPRRDEKVIAGWNGMTIASFAAAATILNEPRYRAAAIKAGEFIWANMRCAEGRLMRSFFNNTRQLDGELEDYGQVARGFLSLFDLTGENRWLERAKSLAQDITARFEDADAGDFFGTIEASGLGRIKPRSDIDQPSGNAVALDVLARLTRRANEPVYRRKAEKALAALSGVALKAPVGGVSVLSAAGRFSRGETGMVQYAGNGVMRVTALPSAGKQLITVRVDLAEGWHINADKPLEDHLIPTRLDVEAAGKPVTASISYPKPLHKKLAFNDKPMALYENTIEIAARIENPGTAATASAVLQVQTCSDEICLLPETLHLKFAWPQ